MSNITSKTDNRYLIKVSDSIPSLQECCDFVSDSAAGAISTFQGITRDNYQGNKVVKLSYEAYESMAVREIEKLCSEANEVFASVIKIAAVHILGDCPVGSTSVILCASSPHRKDAIRCVEFLIDELKARIPIWKKEVYEDDEGKESVWKENVEWSEGKQRRVMVKQDR